MEFLRFFRELCFESNIITSIISIVFSSITFYTIFILVFENIINKELSNFKKTIFIIINSLIFSICSIFIKSTIAQLIVIVFSTIYLIILTKEHFIKYFLYSTIFSIFLLNSEILILKPITYILNKTTYSSFITIPFFWFGLLISLLISFTLTCYTIKNLNINFVNIFNKKTIYEKFIIYIIDFIIIFQILNSLYIFKNTEYSQIFLLTYLILNFYFWISIKDIVRIFIIEDNEQKILNLELYNKTISEAYDSTRTFKHDFHNIIQAMSGYLSTNDLKGLKKYFNQLLPEIKNINSLSKLNPELINNPAIYSILADKHFKAEKFNVNLNLEILMDLNSFNNKIYEITRILGILLDNAIETAKDCDDKTINVIFKQSNYRQIIKIENTYTNKEICIDKIFDKGYSTKPNNTGLGLWEVKKILSKNENLNLFTSKNNDFFMQQLEIY